MSDHDGRLLVSSEPGKGSVFTIDLPLVDDEAKAKDASGAAPTIGGLTVLVVDDDALVREMACELVADLRCSALAAASGEEAVRIFAAQRDRGAPIDVVLLDLSMPGMDGRQALEHLRAIDRDVRVVIASGHIAPADARDLVADGVVAVLQKPYRRRELARAIMEASPVQDERAG